MLSFVLLQALSSTYIFPVLNAWNQARNMETSLLQIPVFQRLKAYDKKTYGILLAEIENSLKKGNDESEIISVVREHIAKLIQQRLPSASDEAVITYMKTMLVEMAELNQLGGDLCFRFIFPQQSGGAIDSTKYLSKRTQEADLAALAEVIRTSAENPQPVPQESDVVSHLDPIYAELVKEHGEEIAMLQNPTGANVDKHKVCVLAADFYTRILKLPTQEGSKVIRFLLSKE